jgi:hypothetical protein
MAELFNRHFSPAITLLQMKAFMGNRRLCNGRDGRFRPGNVPFNKGRKGVVQGGVETQFKPGHLPWNYRPVGSERINPDGYAEVKTADPDVWKGRHIIIWEAANGTVPPGHVIIFADGTRKNLVPDNLLVVSRRELAVMNQMGLISGSADLTRVGKSVADIRLLIADRKRVGKSGK